MSLARSLCPALLLALALSACRGGAGGGVRPLESIDGTWVSVSAEVGGKSIPEFRKRIRLMGCDGAFSMTMSDRWTTDWTLKLDPTTSPKSLDMIGMDGMSVGQTIRGIYERTGDTLRICYDPSGIARPTRFHSKEGTELVLITYVAEE